MKISKVFVIGLAVMAMTILLGYAANAQERMDTISAPGQSLPQPRVVKGPVHVGYCAPDMTAESSQRDWWHAQIEIAHRKWKVSQVLDAGDATKQQNAMKIMIDKGVDAIVIVYWQMEPLRDLILEARKKGIGVYCVDTELRPGVLVNTTQPNGVVGATMAYYIIDRLEGRGNVAILNLTYHILRQRCYVAKALFDSRIDWPSLNCVGMEDMPVPGWERRAFDQTTGWLQKYGKKLNAVFAGWDTPGIFAARAIEAYGHTRKDTFVTGIDGGSEAYDMIRAGSPFIATMSQPFEEYVHNLFEVIEQVQVKGIGIGEKDSMLPPYRVIYSRPVLTTPDNLPPLGMNIHAVFGETYYDPNNKEAWYNWGTAYKITSAAKK